MKDERSRIAATGGAILLASLLYGCSSVRLSGYSPDDTAASERSSYSEERSLSISASTSTAKRRKIIYVIPEISTSTERSALYYSDLGPDTVDVSGYPARQRHNYAAYRMACSQCHTLARSINAPVAGRRFWAFYVMGMRFNAYFSRDKQLPKDDVRAVLDFLEYDSNFRKREHRPEFEALETELKRRFESILEKRMRRLQETPQPTILRRR